MTTRALVTTDKSIEEYSNVQLFLGSTQGLMDTIHRPYPKIWDLYKEMKSLDWDEAEFDFSQCLLDFKTAHADTSDAMIETLAFQWEADTWAAKSIIACFAPFITSTELWYAWCRITDNENIHAATYSEIVRMSFDDNRQVLQQILEIRERLDRIDVVSSTFSQLYAAGLKYSQGELEASEELADLIYIGVATLFVLERIQFMSSFAVTFTIAALGIFQSIAKAVQKIAQDELEIHCELDREVLRNLRASTTGFFAGVHERCAGRIAEIVDAVIAAEDNWTDVRLFKNGARSIVGLNSELVKQWVRYNARDVIEELDLEDLIDSKTKLPKNNPLPNMTKWLNMNKLQAAIQEQDSPAYKVNTVVDDTAGVVYDLDF